MFNATATILVIHTHKQENRETLIDSLIINNKSKHTNPGSNHQPWKEKTKFHNIIHLNNKKAGS
jgi:hypothetical protein